MSPLFDVPADELRTERINLPNGRYQGDFAGAEFVGNDNGWRAIKPRFENLSTAAGDRTVDTTGKSGKPVTIDLSARQHSTAYTVEAENAQAKEIGARDIVRLAQALGLAENGGDRVTVPGDTPEEVLELLNSRVGTRVNFSIANKPRMRNKIVQTGNDGEPIVDDNIARVWPVEAA